MILIGISIRRFWPESLARYFWEDSGLVYDSPPAVLIGPPPGKPQPEPAFRVMQVCRAFCVEFRMPYALFCNDARLSNAYPTEADVWELARKSGLVVEAVSGDNASARRPLLENDYEIRPCRADPQEDPFRNRADAERENARGLEWDTSTPDA